MNTTGQHNIAIGHEASYFCTTCTGNVAIGKSAFYGGQGSRITAIGYEAMFNGPM
ncbi:MAG: hypothetical protein IPH36_12730 [Saprospiraceae bacterium]|nr:hypothetical protein [Saprospiraceae bacterium]